MERAIRRLLSKKKAGHTCQGLHAGQMRIFAPLDLKDLSTSVLYLPAGLQKPFRHPMLRQTCYSAIANFVSSYRES
jgi:hypothetical protein